MAERKGMTSLLSKVARPATPDPDTTPPPAQPPTPPTRARKPRLFDQLNAVSALDAEPDLARIARNVSLFSSRPRARPEAEPAVPAEAAQPGAPAPTTPTTAPGETGAPAGTVGPQVAETSPAAQPTPTAPVEPGAPVARVAPVEPVLTTAPTAPAGSVTPVAPVGPVEPAPRTEPVGPAQTGAPGTVPAPGPASAPGAAPVFAAVSAPASAPPPPEVLPGAAPAASVAPPVAGDQRLPLPATDRPAPGSGPEIGPRENGWTKWSDHVVQPSGQTKWSDQMAQLVGPNGQTIRSDQMVQPNGQTKNSQVGPNVTRTRQQKAVFGYLAANPDITTSVNNLSEILSIPPTTLRKMLHLFERAGKIRKTRIGNDGLRILFVNAFWSDQTVGPNGPTKWSDQNDSKRDRLRKDSSLSISLKSVGLTWPNLARAGFGPEQLEQVFDNLASLGKPLDRVTAGLDHAEWELEHGAMTDKEGNPVADPCAWVFRSLARTGYYRRPPGYVSPEEQAARDAEAEARALGEARRAAEAARFAAWREALTPAGLAAAMVGYPGGPKDAWLRACWKRLQAEDNRGDPAGEGGHDRSGG